MTAGELCNREVIVTTPETGIGEAAKLMREHHVGTLVVVERQSGRARPLGILTDRDLVIEVLAEEVPAAEITVGDVMNANPMRVRASDGLWDTLQIMRGQGIRRIVVVEQDDALAGILAMDDVIALLAEEITLLAKLIAREQSREQKVRPAKQP